MLGLGRTKRQGKEAKLRRIQFHRWKLGEGLDAAVGGIQRSVCGGGDLAGLKGGEQGPWEGGGRKKLSETALLGDEKEQRVVRASA